jgi:hypothetical protein
MQSRIGLRTLSLLVAFATTLSCNTTQRKSGQSESADPSPTPTASPEPKPTDVPYDLATKGLPPYCVVTSSTKTKFCIECKPRKMPLNHCFNTTHVLKPAKECRYLDRDITCSLGAGIDETFNVDVREAEETFEKLPILVLALKLYATQKIKGNEEDLHATLAVLDFLQKNIQNLVTGTKADQTCSELKALVDTELPQAEEAQLTALLSSCSESLAKLEEERQAGKVDVEKTYSAINKIIKALPLSTDALAGLLTPELLGQILGDGAAD